MFAETHQCSELSCLQRDFMYHVSTARNTESMRAACLPGWLPSGKQPSQCEGNDVHNHFNSCRLIPRTRLLLHQRKSRRSFYLPCTYSYIWVLCLRHRGASTPVHSMELNPIAWAYKAVTRFSPAPPSRVHMGSHVQIIEVEV